jgi:transcriptional regulator with XRE-family HTH domain
MASRGRPDDSGHVQPPPRWVSEAITWQVVDRLRPLRQNVPMTSLHTQHPPLGSLVKEWRQRRRLSRLDLAIEADVSSRHVSFIETGRSAPSRAMVLRLAAALDVPLREQNQLLMAAGLAPVYAERSLEDPDMVAVRDGIEQVL